MHKQNIDRLAREFWERVVIAYVGPNPKLAGVAADELTAEWRNRFALNASRPVTSDESFSASIDDAHKRAIDAAYCRSAEAERKRCARIAKDAESLYDNALGAINHESWGWAMNEMGEPTHEQWTAAVKHFREIAARIVSGE
jgi:hypothetical protein